MNSTLRPASAKDAVRIAELLIVTRAAFMSYAPSVHTDDDVRAFVGEVLVPGGGVTVAEVNGRVVGGMATAFDGEASWINQMAVDPALVGNGIGSVLLARAMQTLQPPIRLYAFQANGGARRFYERHGFTATQFTDGEANEERCPDVLYELASPKTDA